MRNSLQDAVETAVDECIKEGNGYAGCPVEKNICHYKICCFALKGYTEWWEGEKYI